MMATRMQRPVEAACRHRPTVRSPSSAHQFSRRESPRSSARDLGTQAGVAGNAGPPRDRRRRLLGVEAPGHPAADRRRASEVYARGCAGSARQPQPKRRPALLDRKSALARGNRAALAAMKEELDLVLAGHLQAVLDRDRARSLLEKDPATVQDRVGEAQVAVLPA